ncbi:hypothetical protein BH18ACT9_BH18ACT9_07260 [soil metagenome]
MDQTGHEVESSQQCADALVANRARILAAEAEQLVLAATWADLHGAPSDPEEVVARLTAAVLPGTELFRRAGGLGTPEVGEFAAAELGVLLGTSTTAAAILSADAVDVRHRLPVLWETVAAGTVRVWQAREAARRTRAAGLSLEQARQVDAATTPYLSTLPWGRWIAVLEARIIEADPAAAEQRRQAAASERFVQTGQCNEYGLKTIVAKAAAGDAIWFLAMCDRIAQILGIEGDTDPVGARRSKALRILASPTEAFALLARHAVEQPLDPWPEQEDAYPGGSPPPDPPDREVAGVDAAKPRPHAVLYLHLSYESYLAALEGRSVGAGRMEGAGPITVEQVREFLGHAQVTLKPVIDLDVDRPVDGYEVPQRMREQLRLRSPATAFPYTPSLSRHTDADHSVPYLSLDRGGPPGQTRIENLGWLLRFHHRVKTHGRGWVHRQTGPGVHFWRTPHGYWARVDPTGTHPLGKDTPVELTGSPLERCFAELVLAA